MAISFADLKKNPLKLGPVAVAIEGLPEPLLIYQFTMNQMAEFDAIVGETDEITIRKKVLRFLQGFDVEIPEDDYKSLGQYFTGWQLREIFTQGLTLNGFGPSALGDAKKNLEPTPSSS
jgi:hypothetical protein